MSDTIEYNFLPLTLSMETVGGIASPLVKRGTPLPAKRKQRFSTAADNQKTVTVSIYYGESPISRKNIPLGKFDLTGIPEAPRGEAEVDIQFEVDKKCQIKVTATAVNSGKAISSTNGEFQTDLTKDKVDEMLRQAIDEQQEDQSLAQQVESKNTASTLLHRAEKYLQSQQKYGIRSSVDNQIEETVASLGLALQDDNIGSIKDKSKRLQELIPNTGVDFGSFFSGDVFGSFWGSGQPIKKQSSASGEKEQTKGTASASSKEHSTTEEIAQSKEGMFSAGQYFDAKRVVRDLFAAATRDIIIVDAYIGEDVLNLLTVKRDGVHVKLLTGKVSPAFLTLARDFNRQYKNLEIRSSKTFHDRFIFVDDRDFYHFGASLEHLGNKTFMFSKLEEPSIIAALKNQWDAGWGQAVVVL